MNVRLETAGSKVDMDRTVLKLRLFGRLQAHLGEIPLPPLRSRKGEWLLALLALRGVAVTRSWLAGTLWPESDDERARHALAQLLYAPEMGDPELVIRTSGEHRLSNFLLWQSAYSEFVFSDLLWPDFDRAELERALQEYATRSRRFGARE